MIPLPIDPCGCWVDWGRHEYQGTIRPYIDRPDVEIPVQWYFAPKNAKPLGMVTCFGDSWYAVDARFTPFVGMTRYFDGNNVGNTTGALGIRPCGTPEQWRFGCSTTDPVCTCDREDMMPVHEIPTGDIDGANRQFFLSQMPITPDSCLLFLNGDQQGPGVNYTLTGTKIFFSAASTPRVGDDLWVYYWRQN